MGCTARAVPNVAEIGYDAEWRDRVAADGENGVRYAAPETDADAPGANEKTHGYEAWKRARMEKRRVMVDVGFEDADGDGDGDGGGFVTSR